MTWIKPVTQEEAEGFTREVFEDFKARGQRPPVLHQTVGRRQAVLKGRETLRVAITAGGTTLGRRREEMLNFFVAALGECTGWVMNHGALLRQAADTSRENVVQIGADYRSADLSPQDKAMLAFAEKLTLSHANMSREDIQELRDAGFSEDNIVDIIASVAYRNFSNRLNIALGLDAPEELPLEQDPGLKAMLVTRKARSGQW